MRLAPLLLLLISFQDPPAEPTGALAWKLGKNDFARYGCTRISLDSAGEESEFANPERLGGIFGYEIFDKINYRPPVNDRAELPLFLGLSLPPRQLKPGQSHDWTVEFDESFDCGPVTAKVSATRVAAVEFDSAACAKLTLTAKLSKSQRPTTRALRAVDKGKFEATLLFDPAKGLARRLDFFFTITLLPTDPKGAI